MLNNDNTKDQLLDRIAKLKNRIVELTETVKVLLNATSDLAFLMDTQGKILYINEAAARRFGKKSGDLIGANIYNFYSNEEREFKQAYMEVAAFSKQPVHFEEVHKGAVFASCIYPVFNPNGDIDKFALFYNDITEHKKIEETIYRYSQIFSTVNAHMSFVDRSYIFRTANEASLTIYGKKREEVIGRPIEEVFGREVFQEHIKASIDKCLKGEKVHYQGWFDFPGRKSRFMFMSYSPLFTLERKVLGAVINAVDITKNREMEEKLKKLYVTDQLTGIFNRVKFCEALDEEIKKLKTSRDANLSIIMFDIDHFKKVNDTYGHDVGDEVIKKLVGVVRGCIRESDTFARWGGEEFMVLLPNADLENAYYLAERIRLKIEKSHFEQAGTVTCCFGIAEFFPDDTVDRFTKRVDKALYKAKQRGRNRVERPKTVFKTG
jgi:diguanylate cyclase (GGDEF)-like protein/PAS domain S-box-containing protein